MDRIELNGYIERLIDSNGQDAEARKAVVDFALGMQGSSPIQLRGILQKPGGSFTGQTPEHGNIKVDDDKTETKEFSHGSVLERVGYYKIWRQKDWIHISHFWKSEAETMSETEQSQQWVLALNKANEPEWFGERGIKHLYTLRLTKLLTIDFSREMFEERWGPSLKKQHKGALAIAVSIQA
jgi:hypothetical protein